jgi:hypothetical protein
MLSALQHPHVARWTDTHVHGAARARADLPDTNANALHPVHLRDLSALRLLRGSVTTHPNEGERRTSRVLTAKPHRPRITLGHRYPPDDYARHHHRTVSDTIVRIKFIKMSAIEVHLRRGVMDCVETCSASGYAEPGYVQVVRVRHAPVDVDVCR